MAVHLFGYLYLGGYISIELNFYYLHDFLCLSVFYFTKGNPFWRYNNGSTNLDIYHPKKSGTIALISDIPDKNSWNYDDRYYTKAESDVKYITDITTSVNKLTFTKNGSNIDRDITVNVVYS